MSPAPSYFSLAFMCLTLSAAVSGGPDNALGINYGTVADNLPSPTQVASLLKSTSITRVKLYNADPSILKAFANTGIRFVIGIPNEDIQALSNPKAALQWVTNNVAPYMPATRITLLAVGNEVLATGNKVLISRLVRTMQNLYFALNLLGLSSTVKVSTPHSLGILHSSVPPSQGTFRGGLTKASLTPMLNFLSKTGSPFMANAYPFFGYLGDPNPGALQYALFTSATGYVDPITHLHYSNMFDAQVDAVYSAMAALGHTDIPVLVSETGWPSQGDPNEIGVNMENAQIYNNNLIKHILSNEGTPLRPNKTIETYIFALFNEDLKPGPTSERNYGLFNPDMSAVYTVGIGKDSVPVLSRRGHGMHSWCIAKAETDVLQLQKTLDYACGQGGAECTAIQESGECYLPNTLIAHASYAMNSYYQKQGAKPWTCYFNNSGVIVHKNPSYGSCVYTMT